MFTAFGVDGILVWRARVSFVEYIFRVRQRSSRIRPNGNLGMVMRFARLIVFLSVTALFQAAMPTSAQETCTSTAVVSVPTRPTVTSAANTTQCGVVELEYGLGRQWPGGGANRDDLTGGLRFGVTRKLDVHWSSADFLHLMDASGNRTGFGDTRLGARYRFLKQTKQLPSFGVLYEAKIPSARVALGLGSGEIDHSISFLVSEDVRRLHFDFNLIGALDGRTAASGFDHSTGFALASFLPITHHLSAVFEPYGYTRLNQSASAFASLMFGFDYQVHPRLYLDTGLDVGATSRAPRKRVFVGITCAVGNVYSWLSPKQ
jgi:hypothetical protein